MKRLKVQYAIIFLAIIYFTGILGLSTEAWRPLFSSLTPYNLLLATGLLAFYHRPWSYRVLLAFALVFIGGMMVEIYGVDTGFVFGHYTYGDVLGIKVLGTPLLIGVNWLMLIYMVYVITSSMVLGWLPRIITGAFMMVLYDLLLEPVAISLGYWSWEGLGIPLQNYMAWWILSALFIALWIIMDIRIKNRLAPALFIIHLAFLLVLNFTL